MWIILDLATLSVQQTGELEFATFQSKAEAEAWNGANRTCHDPFYVHIPDDRGPDVAAARVTAASTLKKLAEESGGYDVLQNALDYLRA